MTRRYFINAAEVAPCEPANHTGTVNRRLVGPDTVGSHQLEILEGTIQPGQGALPHVHPNLDQVVYMLAGRARAEIDGQSKDLAAGDVVFFPKGMKHVFTVVSAEPVKALVMYTPPYMENPNEGVR